MNKKNVFFYFGTLCILGAIIIFSKNLYEDYIVKVKTQKIMNSIAENIDVIKQNRVDYLENPDMDMPIKQLNGYEYIGYLNISNLGLKLPIINAWSYSNIKVSPARYKGSIYKNDMIILAHNYRSHFGKLHRLKLGDEVDFTDMNNNEFKYKVNKIDEIGGDNLKKLLSGNWDLTLFTCTLGGKSRVVIRCEALKDN